MHLLAIAIEQIPVITMYSLLLYTWSNNKIPGANQINHAGNTLLTDSHEILYIYTLFWTDLHKIT